MDRRDEVIPKAQDLRGNGQTQFGGRGPVVTKKKTRNFRDERQGDEARASSQARGAGRILNFRVEGTRPPAGVVWEPGSSPP